MDGDVNRYSPVIARAHMELGLHMSELDVASVIQSCCLGHWVSPRCLIGPYWLGIIDLGKFSLSFFILHTMYVCFL